MPNILISKDGKRLGPFTLEAARSLVLAGTVSATDWAWTDGATDWVPLNRLPGFADSVEPMTASKGVPQAISPLRPPLAASSKAKSNADIPAPEQELWAGSPSQVLNLGFYLKWTLVLLIIGFIAFNPSIAAALHSSGPDSLDFIPSAVFYGALALCLASCGWRALKLHATRYVVTTQRVKVLRGIFSKNAEEIELFRVKDTAVYQPFSLRLFGVGNLRVTSGDDSNPSLLLRAIPKPVQLRERLREEVIVLRQRFNVRELEMM